MLEHISVESTSVPESGKFSAPLLWSERDFLTEITLAAFRDPSLDEFPALLKSSAIPPDHGRKMVRLVKGSHEIKGDMDAMEYFMERIKAENSEFGISPQLTNYDNSRKTCELLKKRLKKAQANAINNIGAADHDYMVHVLGAHGILTREEEYALSSIIWTARSQISMEQPGVGYVMRSGKYEKMGMKQIEAELAHSPRLSTLFSEYREAVDLFVQHNQRLASKFFRKDDVMKLGVPLEELMAFAQPKLIRAAELFDASTGYKFSSFATPYLLWAVETAASSLRQIYVPTRVRSDQMALESLENELGDQLGRPPTAEELTEHITKISHDANRKGEARRYRKFTPPRIKELSEVPRIHTSLDRVVSDTEESTLHNRVYESGAIEEKMMDASRHDAIVQAGRDAGLDDQELRVFELLLPYYDVRLTPDVVSEVIGLLGCSAPSFYQVNSQVMQKMRDFFGSPAEARSILSR